MSTARATTLVLVSLVVVAFAWGATRKSKAVVSPSAPVPTASAKTMSPLRQQLAWEEARLARLQTTLAAVENRQTSSTEAASQVDSLQTQLRGVREQLADRKTQSAQLSHDARAFQRTREIDANNEQVAISSQMQSLDDSIYDVQIQLQDAPMNGLAANPVAISDLNAQLTDLRRQKDQLAAQARTAGLAARNDSLQAQQDAADAAFEIRSDQQALLRQQSDLANALDYWQKQQKALDNPAREKRVESLRRQVENQRRQVAELQKKIY